jgi:hypothetical protein
MWSFPGAGDADLIRRGVAAAALGVAVDGEGGLRSQKHSQRICPQKMGAFYIAWFSGFHSTR